MFVGASVFLYFLSFSSRRISTDSQQTSPSAFEEISCCASMSSGLPMLHGGLVSDQFTRIEVVASRRVFGVCVTNLFFLFTEGHVLSM